MGFQLAGFTVKLFGQFRDIFAWPVIQLGIGPDGKPVPLQASSGGGAMLSFPSGSPTLVPIAASSNASVPIGAKNWTLAILTGTGTLTIGANSIVVAAGYSQSSLTTLATTAINLATDSASTGVLYYET